MSSSTTTTTGQPAADPYKRPDRSQQRAIDTTHQALFDAEEHAYRAVEAKKQEVAGHKTTMDQKEAALTTAQKDFDAARIIHNHDDDLLEELLASAKATSDAIKNYKPGKGLNTDKLIAAERKQQSHDDAWRPVKIGTAILAGAVLTGGIGIEIGRQLDKPKDPNDIRSGESTNNPLRNQSGTPDKFFAPPVLDIGGGEMRITTSLQYGDEAAKAYKDLTTAIDNHNKTGMTGINNALKNSALDPHTKDGYLVLVKTMVHTINKPHGDLDLDHKTEVLQAVTDVLGVRPASVRVKVGGKEVSLLKVAHGAAGGEDNPPLAKELTSMKPSNTPDLPGH